MKKILIVVLAAAVLATGCAAPQTKTGKGALYGTAGGAAAGALAGQLIGRDTTSTLVGAAVGAAIGGLAGAGIGNYMDRQEAEFRQALAQSEAAQITREGNLLAITLKGDVTFDTNSTAVRPGLYNEIDRIAQVMVQYPETQILVHGHTDSTGDAAYNQTLSERRAEAVKNLLIQRGVLPYRVTSMGYGETQPVATNATPEGRQMNRRVEIRIKATEQAAG
jgi:outer membrane protein OmpA-like peptidoglycan-associated protein